MKVTLTRPHTGCFELVASDGQTLFIQSDWDYPSIASNFGFVPCDRCNATDGTVNCKHRTASEMISAAYDFLVEHQDQTFDDPGYFETISE